MLPHKTVDPHLKLTVSSFIVLQCTVLNSRCVKSTEKLNAKDMAVNVKWNYVSNVRYASVKDGEKLIR
jgi:hypothetical protein